MKTMSQMQSELLAQAKFDGTYPKPVVLPLGLLALARNEAEFIKLRRESDMAHRVLSVVLAVILLGFLGALTWTLLT